MASIRKRGKTFTVTVYMGYDGFRKQLKKTTTFRPPEGVTNKKAEKLTREFEAVWENKIKGFIALDENRTFSELAQWYNTHASLLINSDIYAKVISSQLGHSTIKTTLDIYSHVFEENKIKAMQAVEMKLFETISRKWSIEDDLDNLDAS